MLNINSYTVGNRISNNHVNGDDTDWCGLEEKQAEMAIESVIDSYNHTIQPWFCSVRTIPEFIFEIAANYQKKAFSSLEDAVAFAEGGKRDRAWWICSDIMNEEIPENIDSEKKKEILLCKKACQQYLDVHDAESYSIIAVSKTNGELFNALSELPKHISEVESIDEILQLWRNNKLEKFKLSKCIA